MALLPSSAPPALPAVVFGAWAKPEFKRQWFGSPKEGSADDIFEFRVEWPREFNEGKMGSDVYTYDVLYQDIIENNRIIYTYRSEAERPAHLGVGRHYRAPARSRWHQAGAARRTAPSSTGSIRWSSARAAPTTLIDQLGAWLDKQ